MGNQEGRKAVLGTSREGKQYGDEKGEESSMGTREGRGAGGGESNGSAMGIFGTCLFAWRVMVRR